MSRLRSCAGPRRAARRHRRLQGRVADAREACGRALHNGAQVTRGRLAVVGGAATARAQFLQQPPMAHGSTAKLHRTSQGVALPCAPDASMYEVARFHEMTFTSASCAATDSIDLLCRRGHRNSFPCEAAATWLTGARQHPVASSEHLVAPAKMQHIPGCSRCAAQPQIRWPSRVGQVLHVCSRPHLLPCVPDANRLVHRGRGKHSLLGGAPLQVFNRRLVAPAHG